LTLIETVHLSFTVFEL